MFDLALTIQLISQMLHEKPFTDDGRMVEGITVQISEGEAAGQQIKHLHAHVIPRRTNDFDRGNDVIYEKLANFDDMFLKNLGEIKSRDSESKLSLAAALYKEKLEEMARERGQIDDGGAFGAK